MFFSRFDKFKDHIDDYNTLIRLTAELDPAKPSDRVKLLEIDASNSSVSGFGCRHFSNFSLVYSYFLQPTSIQSNRWPLSTASPSTTSGLRPWLNTLDITSLIFTLKIAPRLLNMGWNIFLHSSMFIPSQCNFFVQESEIPHFVRPPSSPSSWPNSDSTKEIFTQLWHNF